MTDNNRSRKIQQRTRPCGKCTELFDLPLFALTLSDVYGPLDVRGILKWYHRVNHNPWEVAWSGSN